jgi:hypothetical protein
MRIIIEIDEASAATPPRVTVASTHPGGAARHARDAGHAAPGRSGHAAPRVLSAPGGGPARTGQAVNAGHAPGSRRGEAATRHQQHGRPVKE